MTNERVSGFASELVQMATAAAKLPELEGQVEALTIRCESLRDTIQRLEMKAMDRNAEIIDLNASIRKLEVERDTAETMFLEADDKASAWRRLVGSFQADAKALLEAQEPVKPVVDPTPVPVPQIGTGTDASQSGTEGPFVSTADPAPSQSDATSNIAEGGQREAILTEGVSVQPDPIATTQKQDSGATTSADTSGSEVTHASDGHIETGQREADPTQSGQSGPLPASQSGEKTSSGTEASQGSTTPTEAKPAYDSSWPYVSRASHNS